MTKTTFASHQNTSGIYLQQLVQKMAKDAEKKNSMVSYELFEDVAQSLAAIKTSLVIMEKKLPVESAEISSSIRDMDQLLQKTLCKIRGLADDLYSSTLTNLGLEPALNELCKQFENRTGNKVGFRGYLQSPVPARLDHSQELCLYTFSEQVLELIAIKGYQGCISLDYSENEVMLDFRCHLDKVDSQRIIALMEPLIPVLQEWLHLWDGKLQTTILPEGFVNLTASLEVNSASN
jgi:signal transduction histidine kinase